MIVITMRRRRKVPIDIQLGRNAQGAFDTLPDQFRVGNDALSNSIGPDCIGDDITIDFREMEEKVAISPVCGVLGEIGRSAQGAGRIWIPVLGKSLSKEGEELCVWRRGDKRGDLGCTVNKGEKYIVWKRCEVGEHGRIRAGAGGGLASKINELVRRQTGLCLEQARSGLSETRRGRGALCAIPGPSREGRETKAEALRRHRLWRVTRESALTGDWRVCTDDGQRAGRDTSGI